MNLLYIGPYRQYDYMGQTSRILLHSIKEKLYYRNHSVYSRPVYIDTTTIDRRIPKYIEQNEIFPNNPINWSAIIQNLPVEFLAVQNFTKNIAIPILNNQLVKTSLNNSCFKKLNLFDAVIVENDNQKNLLLKSGLNTKILVCNEKITDGLIDDNIKNKQFDLGVLNNNFIFSFIGSYRANKNIIEKLIMAFLVSFRAETDNTLFLLLRGTSEEQKELADFYNQIKQKLNIINMDPVVFSFGSLELNECIAAINTCSCFLSINNDIQYAIYEKYAQSLDKKVVSKYSLDIVNTPALGVGLLYDIEDVIGSIGTMSLVEKLKSIKLNNITKNNSNNHKSIGEIICNILD